MMPVVAVLLSVVLFYVKVACLLAFCKQPKQLFSSAALTTFFLLITLLTLAAPAAPVAWALARMKPACGPHTGYNYPYEVVPDLIDSAPAGFASFLYFF